MKTAGWLVIVLAAGWLSGFLIHRAASPAEVKTAAPPEIPRQSGAREPVVEKFTAPGWGLREGIGLAELRTTAAGARRTAETAMWLTQAGAEDIADWWPALSAESPQDQVLVDLVMVRWMALAPLDALKIVQGTSEEFRAWWSWGKVNAGDAVREAKARRPGFLWRVMQGAGLADPQLAMRLAEENPALAYPAVLVAIKDGLKDQGWQESLEYQFSDSTLQSWSRYEPKQALDWALANSRKLENSTWEELVDRLGESDPDHLDRLIESLPSGKVRELILIAQVGRLAASDLDAAFALAGGTESGPMRNKLYQSAARCWHERDPAAAAEYFGGGGPATAEQRAAYESAKGGGR
jgi:hypothetical protein